MTLIKEWNINYIFENNMEREDPFDIAYKNNNSSQDPGGSSFIQEWFIII